MMYFVSRDDVALDSMHVSVGDIFNPEQMAAVCKAFEKEFKGLPEGGYIDGVMCFDLDMAMEWQDFILRELSERLASI